MFTVSVLEKCRIVKGKIEDIRRNNVSWGDFLNPTASELKKVSEIVGMGETEIRELLNSNARPVLTNIEKYSVILFQSPAEAESVTMPMLVFISKRSNDFITIHLHESNSIKRMLAWDEKRKVRVFSKGTTYLLYHLVDEISASYAAWLELMDDKIEQLEDSIYAEDGGHKDMMRQAFEVKKKLIYFYKALSANRDVVSSIEKEYGAFLNKKDLSKFRLMYSDFTQLLELTVTYRDILTTTIEVYLSVVSNSLNVTMKKLTAWGAIILLPSLVSGIYGMNFRYLPEAEWRYGYLFALGIMTAMVVAAYAYFKRKEWI
ncbi:MAG TPA: magnesium/cobalt transporter CorA [Nanoarchaeota archaeon]|nr:magnesium/cobalt transporter CorA [Nanoarchaeota archaeon]